MAAGLAAGRWLDPPLLAGKREVWIRECYRDFYTDIWELSSLGMRFIHVSGNPGIGKSCFLWYVLARLLEAGVPTVIVELVQGDPPVLKKTLVYKQDGSCSEDVPPDDYYAPETWVLTDQAFVGNRAWSGTTVLFASPKESNWIHAEKTMDESKFTTLYMPPWSVDELQAVYFSKPENARRDTDFWVKYYVAGPIVRYYFMPLKKAYNKIKFALTKVVDAGVVNATLFNGGWDDGLFSHKIFVFWPSLDFTSVDHISFTSEFAADCFAIACFKGKIKDWVSSTLSLAADRSLRSAAGVLFERYAHFRLSRGGEFCSIDDPARKLHLEKREVRFFSGNSLNLQTPDLCYLQPSSTCFPVIDSVYPPLIVFQISLALKRRAIKKSDYEALCSALMACRSQHPNAPTGLESVQEPGPDRVYAVLVKLEGDNAKHSQRLCMVEDVPVDQTASRQPKRKRARTVQSSISKVKHEETGGFVKKRTYLPFQMTIALKMNDTVAEELEYTSIKCIYDIVRSRMYDKVDTGSRKFGDMTTEEATFASVLMRRGMGRIQYEEAKDGVPEFGAWIEAVRTKDESDFVEKTVVSIQCTAGELAGRELTVFVNERLSPDTEFASPLILNMLHETSEICDEPALADAWNQFKAFQRLGTEAHDGADVGAATQIPSDAEAAFRRAYGGVYQFWWSGETATVVIRSNQRASRKFKLVFPVEGEEEEHGEDEDEDDGEDEDEDDGEDAEEEDMEI